MSEFQMILDPTLYLTGHSCDVPYNSISTGFGTI